MGTKKPDLTEYAISLVKDIKLEELDRFSPYYHGTSTYHARKIKEQGELCPRGERPSVWDTESGKLLSHTDKVYFAACNETQIPDASAYRAKESAQYHKKNDIRAKRPITIEDLETINEEKEEKIYFQLKSMLPFQNEVVADEDNNFPHLIKGTIYNPDPNYKYNPFVIGGSGNIIPKKVIDALDIAYFDQGFEGVQKVVQSIPPAIQSLYSNQTIAIHSKCVPTTQMTTLTQEEFYDPKNRCRKSIKESVYTKEESDIRENVSEALSKIRYLKKYNKPKNDYDPHPQTMIELQTEYEEANKKLREWIYDHKIKNL